MESNADMSLVKLANYRRVWDYVHSHGEETIPQISKATGLSLPTVTRAIKYSLEEGIIHPVGIVGGERGRKAQLYSLAPDYMHFVFVSIHSNKLHFEIHDFLSRVIQKGTFIVDDKTILSTLCALIEEAIKKDLLIKFLGIAFSGVVFEGKIIESIDFPSLVGFSLKEYLENEYSIMVTIENDLNAAAVCFSKYTPEYKAGITVAFYFGNEGYGSGILIDGKLLHGVCGSAGELHNVVTTNKNERSSLTYAEALRSLVTILNPDRVVLYPNGNADFEEVKKLAFIGVPEYQVPQFIGGRDFTTDIFIGLGALCKKMLIEPYAKVRVLKLAIK